MIEENNAANGETSQEKAKQFEDAMQLINELFLEEAPAEEIKDNLYHINKDEDDTFQFINFLVDKEWYGIAIIKVKEIIKVPQITYLPSSPSFIAGICNLRGNILTVINTKRIFGLSDTPITTDSRVVVVDSGKITLGFLVDAVSEVVELPKSAIDDPLVTLEGEKGEYIIGEAKLEDKLVAVLDIDKLIYSQCVLSSPD
ncbi:MAG: chemotaxis protein CheW [Candidatus Aureabacteria bacterium]|nr:chemotaxis protein CheW [Candidatus Auribacterota bacterium]